ncbi:MAG TPA: hypothetical protein VM096_15885, partial [Vicinamibacterales bacterium]|nr:hypothetical protein [Vicinamibacterales bacterium]
RNQAFDTRWFVSGVAAASWWRVSHQHMKPISFARLALRAPRAAAGMTMCAFRAWRSSAYFSIRARKRAEGFP